MLVGSMRSISSHIFDGRMKDLNFVTPKKMHKPKQMWSSWWLKPIWKICSSSWESSPNRGENKLQYVYLKPFVPPLVWQSHACERAWHAHQVHWPYHPLGMGNSTKETVPGRQIWWPSFVDLPQPLKRPWQPPALYAGITFSSQLYLRDGTRKGRHLQFEDQEWTALIDECDAISISDPLSDVYHLESVGR